MWLNQQHAPIKRLFLPFCLWLGEPPAQAPPQLPARSEGLMARREDNFPSGIRIIFDSITYYLLHYWEFYLSREDVRPIPQGHHLFDPGDDIDLTAIPLWVRVWFTPLEIPVPL